MTFKPAMVAAIQAGQKTVTRRKATAKAKPGQVLAVQLGMGRESIGRIEVVSVRDEPLGDVTDAEARLEGVEDRAAFIALWEEINGSWEPEQLIKRIEFREIDRFKSICTCCGGLGAVTS